MSRREYTQTFRCGEQGCRETTISVETTRRDADEVYARYRKTPWRCLRHTYPDEVLNPVSLTREAGLTVMQSKYRKEFHGDRYPRGFVDGPGFRAFADDFPVGTVLRVTAQIMLPAVEEVASP